VKTVEETAWRLLTELDNVRPEEHDTFKSYEERRHEMVVRYLRKRKG
jgi:hypothetical protein